MNRMPLLFLGFFLTFTSSWIGLVLVPYIQLGHLAPADDDTGAQMPPLHSGLEQYGARVYASNGCLYCHTQQVRGESYGSDIARGWGARRTVARDYINEKKVFLGTMRTGPDLANIGHRQPSLEWHYKHLYSPQAMVAHSVMPPFRYLFIKQRIGSKPSPLAVDLKGTPYEPEAGYEIVPTYEAQALVAYLISLDRSYGLPEAPTE